MFVQGRVASWLGTLLTSSFAIGQLGKLCVGIVICLTRVYRIATYPIPVLTAAVVFDPSFRALPAGQTDADGIVAVYRYDSTASVTAQGACEDVSSSSR